MSIYAIHCRHLIVGCRFVVYNVDTMDGTEEQRHKLCSANFSLRLSIHGKRRETEHPKAANRCKQTRRRVLKRTYQNHCSSIKQNDLTGDTCYARTNTQTRKPIYYPRIYSIHTLTLSLFLFLLFSFSLSPSIPLSISLQLGAYSKYVCIS